MSYLTKDEENVEGLKIWFIYFLCKNNDSLPAGIMATSLGNMIY